MKDSADLLAVYLNDHLAGAAGGVELLRRAAQAARGQAASRQLHDLADEVAEDRASLMEIMRELDIRPRRSRLVLGRLGERAGRLKTNGHLLSRSPLSDLLELEAMRLGVEGKACCWRTLRELAGTDPRLDPRLLDRLLRRAEAQIARLERLRAQTAVATFRVAEPKAG
ncbi:hypothetical protein KQH42_29065 [Streptomyces sp. CHA1]|uniref:hypothetical protein n=1 Tax=unclassified Streptomyces TaxID=2593676 RepID=UPI001BFC9EE5|nr:MULTISPECIES: hypothetical protein [unclassified Streptomyces]MBT3161185.1 hypothetical protein [Streptomyces sp. G11C]MCO6704468.1 hypothetical protein [Streptomyces sp. CHB9.2]MCO6710737.1 hypothetical protein [Streptomyces sp. CHA3]MCO6716539.1 hypothetical protein [Streptomyces sp. CHB19.2]MCO6722672.1 hypothetical protein [Streptomyces sp. Vc714c-19]